MTRCPPGCTCPRPHHPRFEAPVLAFVVVGLTGYACLFLGAWAFYLTSDVSAPLPTVEEM